MIEATMVLELEASSAQIQRIIQSKTFRTSEVHRNLLTYLAEKSLAGESDSLKEYTVGLDVFAKPASYDPRQESTVRMHVGRLRQKLASMPPAVVEQGKRCLIDGFGVILAGSTAEGSHILRQYASRTAALKQATILGKEPIVVSAAHAALANGGSDNFIDQMCLWGSVEKVKAGLRAHFEAGATHVAIQPVHQTRPLALLALQRLQHSVEMLDDARAALGRQPARLIEHEQRRILMDDKTFHELPVGLAHLRRDEPLRLHHAARSVTDRLVPDHSRQPDRRPGLWLS